MNAVLIRHTRIVAPPGVCYGQSDVPLADTFPEEARLVGERLPWVPAEVWTSPALRCRALAGHLGAARVRIEPRLQELNFGAWEGRCWEDFRGAASEAWALDPWNERPPGGETAAELWARVDEVRAELLARNADRIALVTHAGVIRAWRGLTTGRSPRELWSAPVEFGRIEAAGSAGDPARQNHAGRPPQPCGARVMRRTDDFRPMAAMAGRIIISGGPGAGKTALIAALAAAGYPCFTEVSRQLIGEQQRNGGRLLPWMDMTGFADACLGRMVRQLDEARAHRLSFFDRGIPDLIGYLYHRGLVPRRELFTRAADYTPLVFMAAPWREIFVNDSARPQTFSESAAIHRELCRAYRECGFALLTLPLTPVAARVDFVRRALANPPVPSTTAI